MDGGDRNPKGGIPIIPTDRIRPFIEAYVERYGLRALIQDTGLSERRIYEIRTRQANIREDTADRILTGIGHNDAWYVELEDLSPVPSSE